MQYLDEVIAKIIEHSPGQPEFHQAVREIYESLEPVVIKHESDYRRTKLLEMLSEPERSISFRVPWIDDHGRVHMNRGYRIQFNSALGPYKGGLRFHPSVNRGIVKFLGFEQIFKNALTCLPIGGAKGGANFDPKGRSDQEIMSFCQSFMTELFRHIGPNVDVPAGDIGVGGREIGFLFGQYKRLTRKFEGALSGKGVEFGGSQVRVEATGYGAVYLTEEMLADRSETLEGKKVVISGSGNVALYAMQKAQDMGANVVTASDSSGFIYNESGIDFETLRRIKEEERGRVKDYAGEVPGTEYYENAKVWSVPCDLVIPCATQNEITLDDAKKIAANGCHYITEGSNMPCTREATDYLVSEGVTILPSKAANAGGVAISTLEMSQNSVRQYRTFTDLDRQLKDIMINIYRSMNAAADDYGVSGNYISGANIAGFRRVAKAMRMEGYV